MLAVFEEFRRQRFARVCGLTARARGKNMLETIVVILLVLWLIGLVTSHTFGGMLHLLLIVAAIVFVVRLLSGRRVL
jgi:hypothetical protein